jgi:hypothetical protein
MAHLIATEPTGSKLFRMASLWTRFELQICYMIRDDDIPVKFKSGCRANLDAALDAIGIIYLLKVIKEMESVSTEGILLVKTTK